MELTPEQARKALELCANDGYTIISAREFDFLPQGFLTKVTKEHFSDPSNPKYQITDNEGRPQASMTGVYTLDLLYALARDCAADTARADEMYGRGNIARELTRAIQLKLGIDNT